MGLSPQNHPLKYPKKLHLFMLKGPRKKNITKLFIRVPGVRNGQCKQFHARLYPCQQPQKGTSSTEWPMQAISREALPPPATPKGVTTYGLRNGLLFMLKGPRLKTVAYRTLGFPEYGMANASNFTRGFTPASNPERGHHNRPRPSPATEWKQWGIRGNEMGFYLC